MRNSLQLCAQHDPLQDADDALSKRFRSLLYKITQSFGIKVNSTAEEDSEELCDLENSHFSASFRSFASKKKLKEEQKKSKLKQESSCHENRSEEPQRTENKEEEKEEETKELESSVSVELESIAHYSEACCPSEVHDFGLVFQHSETNGNSIDLRTKKNIVNENMLFIPQGRKIASSESMSSAPSWFKHGDSSNEDNQSINSSSSNSNSNPKNVMENKKVESVDDVHLSFAKNSERKEEEEEKKNKRYNKVLERKELILEKEKIINLNRENFLIIDHVDVQSVSHDFTPFIKEYIQHCYQEERKNSRAHSFATNLFDM
jgi:hypothetical protein